ncbi:phage baseplate assembly protein V [Xenorhabdus bovienii]|uniref:phage baseplate assembly protein V n=1 Tax=Xenorhabdus bovienii TaxID=40576 RepID=UPI0023B348F9|nr:phage baseplate assembly protein V [Xenorhabdus bovienii]MDE9461079.1 phage baseplate assembly protein V [Xenorhabdus bovienii]MDE9468184.1 phage baseplate assembly protein V [Xenorhabdus bovienii]
MKLPTLPTIEVKVGGKALSQFSVISVTVNYHINGIPSATVTLGIVGDTGHIFDSQAQAELAHCRPNSEFIVQIQKSVVFKGIIVRQGLGIKGQDNLVTLTARHPLQKLTHGLRSQLFSQQSDEAIIRKLFDQAGLSATIKQAPQLKTVHEQMVQFRCNDWSFLRKRLNATNTWLLPYHNAVTLVTPESLNQSKVHTLRQRASTQDIVLFEANLQWDNQYNPKSVSIQSWDITQQKLSQAIRSENSALGSGQLGSDEVSALTHQEWQWVFSYPLDSEQTRSLAQGILNSRRNHNVSGHVIVAGDNSYQVGDVLALSDFGQGMDGQAIITGVSQSLNQRQGWRTRLTVGMPPESEPPVPQAKELHIGVVEKYQQDSQSLGRIPVKIPALGLTNSTLFARLGKPYASNESGFCFYPEPGDEVIIGFFECDPRFPVILGSMHNPKNRAPLEPSEDNPVKTLVIKQGKHQQSLVFDNKEKILTVNSGEHTLSLQQDKDITLNSAKNLITQAQEIKIQAEKNLSASGKSGVDIKGAKINLTQ